MTPGQWSNSDDPGAMLQFLRDSGQLSERKARLFAVACCRRVEECLGQEMKTLLAAVERIAGGGDDIQERKSLRAEAMQAGWHPGPLTGHARGPAKAAVSWALARRPYAAAVNAATYALAAAVQYAANKGELATGPNAQERLASRDAKRLLERGVQADILRDLVGNPFSPLPAIEPSLLSWHGDLITSMARAAYDIRILPEGTLGPGHLAVLCDALEESSLAEPELLEHLRGGQHWRGCHAIDALLGKP